MINNEFYPNDGKQRKKRNGNNMPENEYAGTVSRSLRDSEGYAAMQRNMADISRSQHYLQELGDNENRRQYYNDSMRDYLVPEDTEQRRRQQFVLSKNGVNDAIDEYYNNTLQPQFHAQRKEAEAEGRREYMRYAGVPGANPHTAIGQMQHAADPNKVINSTMENLDDDTLDEIAAPYARYAGFDPQAYREGVLKPHLQNKMVDEYVNERTPKSSLEYITRAAVDNSLTGKMINLSKKAYAQTDSYNYINDAAMQNYNPNKAEDFAAGVGSLLTDSAVFYALGAVAGKAVNGATTLAKTRLANKVLAKGAARGMTKESANAIADRFILNNIKTKILQSSGVQGLTLGTYDAANSVADDLLHGGDVSLSRAAGAFAKGMGTGAALAVVGTPLKEQARKLAGAKRVLANTGVITAESAVFTASTEASKLASGVDIEPIDLVHDFGESAATLLAMRMFHWRPNAHDKLNPMGHLKGKLRFSLAERQEIERAGVNADSFIAALEKSMRVNSRGFSKDALEVKDKYMKLMESPELSASARSKLLYIVENKVTSTPPVPVDYKVEKLDDGKISATLYDITGGKIESEIFENKMALETFLLRNTGALRANRISSYEEILQRNYNTQDFFRQANEYAKEKNVDVNRISDAMYKKAKNETLTPDETNMLGEIMSRTSYGEGELAKMLADMRSDIEKEYDLHPGTISYQMKKNPFRCSPQLNAALDKYESLMYEQVRALQNGEHRRVGDNASELNMSNADRIAAEREQYLEDLSNSETGNLGKHIVPDISERLGEFVDYNNVYVPKQWNKPYVWSLYGTRKTPGELKQFSEEAQKLGDLFNVKLNFIFDEREIKNNKDKEYGKQVRSLGWYNTSDHSLVINLPNHHTLGSVRNTVVHEVVGHYGLSRVFGSYYLDFLEELYYRASPQVKYEINSIARGKPVSLHDRIDEYLAGLTEYTTPEPEHRTMIQRLHNFLRNMLVRFKIYKSESEIGKDDLIDLLERHHGAMARKYSPYRSRQEVFGDFSASQHWGGYNNMDNYFNRERALYEKDRNMNYAPEEFRESRKAYMKQYFGKNINIEPSENSVNISGNKGKRYRFIGVEGAKNLNDARHTEHIKQYKEAVSMRKAGHSPQYIKMKTGWEVGGDGKWRKEIADNIQIKDYISNSLLFSNDEMYDKYNYLTTKSGKLTTNEYKQLLDITLKETPYDNDATLVDIVSDNLFFNAYPDLKHLPVRFKMMKDKDCQYDPRSKVLYVDKRAFESPKFAEELTLSMQRMIQDYEDFSRGFDLAAIATNEERQAYKDAKGMIATIEEMISDGDVYNRVDRLKKEFRDRYNLNYDEFTSIYPSLNEFVSMSRTGNADALVGNVELRNVKRRMTSIPDYKRRAFLSSKTEDVPRERQRRSVRFSNLDGPVDIIYSKLRQVESDERYPRMSEYESYKPSVMQDREFEMMIEELERRIYRDFYDRQEKRIKEKERRKRKGLKDDDSNDNGKNGDWWLN